MNPTISRSIHTAPDFRHDGLDTSLANEVERHQSERHESSDERTGSAPEDRLPEYHAGPTTHHQIEILRKRSKSDHLDKPERTIETEKLQPIAKTDVSQKFLKNSQKFTLSLNVKSFAQNNPVKTLLLCLLAPFAFIGYTIINTVPALIFAVIILCSKGKGSGQLAKSLLNNKFVKALLGKYLLNAFAKHYPSASGMIGIPLLGSSLVAVSALFTYYSSLFQRPRSESISAIVESKVKLIDNMARWMDCLPTDERKAVDLQVWKRLSGDQNNDAWLGSLSALLQKWYEGSPKQSNSKQIDPALASRMGNMLKIIQGHHEIFKPYLSSLGLSGLGSCHDLPVLNFLDLELRTQAHQTVLDIKAGKQSLQNLLDVARKRFVFEETQLALIKAAESAGSRDPVESILSAWNFLQKEALLDISHLPYRKYGSDISPEGILSIANGVAEFVNERQKNQEAIDEFLGRDDSPTQWREAKGPFQSDELKNRLADLKVQEDALMASMPEQKDRQTKLAYYESPEYTHYINRMDEILEERSKLTKAASPVRFDATQGKWLMEA